MFRPLRHFLIAPLALLTLLVASCGPKSDATPPSIVAVSPTDGATGVATDSNIAIAFSKPMDQASVQAAFQSATLGAVNFAWNAESTVLTVDPKTDLEGGKNYSFSVAASAKDKAGNALKNPGSFGFKTVQGGAPPTQVRRESATLSINGESVAVDRYVWPDSKGLERSVSLKREGGINSGHGGYAVQFGYVQAGSRVMINASGGPDGGFGYFVSHEGGRNFDDGTQGTVASKHSEDDSPLGSAFPVTEGPVSLAVGASAATASHSFEQTYYRYGTNGSQPITFDGNGNPTDITKVADFKKYLIPLEITWTFTAGKDYPRIRFKYDLEAAQVPVDAVRFDLRGPYGVLDFDAGTDAVATAIVWGDGFYKFTAVKDGGLTWQTPFTWNTPWKGARFQALVFGGKYEMGLFEPIPSGKSLFTDGWANSRGKTGNQLPPDYQWPYQSLNYSLQGNDPTTGKKIAWGSSPFYGTSVSTVYAGEGLAQPFAYGKKAQTAKYAPSVDYSICVVVGQSSNNASLTEGAASQPVPPC